MREERERRRLCATAAGSAVSRSGVVGVSAVLAARVGFVAVVQGSHWKAAAAAQSQSHMVLSAERGDITDRNGVDLATDVDEQDVVVDPSRSTTSTTTRQALSPCSDRREHVATRIKRQRLGKNTWLEYRVIAQNIEHRAPPTP